MNEIYQLPMRDHLYFFVLFGQEGIDQLKNVLYPEKSQIFLYMLGHDTKLTN
jgi:hypothetical protein